MDIWRNDSKRNDIVLLHQWKWRVFVCLNFFLQCRSSVNGRWNGKGAAHDKRNRFNGTVPIDNGWHSQSEQSQAASQWKRREKSTRLDQLKAKPCSCVPHKSIDCLVDIAKSLRKAKQQGIDADWKPFWHMKNFQLESSGRNANRSLYRAIHTLMTEHLKHALLIVIKFVA